MDCYSCKSISGEQRISPGPPIMEGQYWVVEHAYPVKMVGWLVLVLKRHAEALHELTTEEFAEMASMQEMVCRLLHKQTGCRKEYTVCFAEAPHFHHVHVHVIARAHEMPDEIKGTGIFTMLKATEAEAVPREQIDNFCRKLRESLRVEANDIDRR
ncbi:MAG TPA: HIT domain-containing protein [Chloroflexia bacterium]|nr:HIT domain-containing protein [Chloroflexia bacterium]